MSVQNIFNFTQNYKQTTYFSDDESGKELLSHIQLSTSQSETLDI